MTAPHSISSGCAALADEIGAALERVLNAGEGGQERGNAEEALRRILWDNKAGIVAYLRIPALPSGEVEREPGWIDQNHQIDRYGVALMMIREGCADPSGLARRILSEFDGSSVAMSSQPQPAPPFGRWADTIESASLAIGPARSKELDALAAEVRAGGAAQQQISPEAMAWADQEIGAIEEYKKANPDWETHLKPARDLIKPAQGVPEAYRETVQRVGAAREARLMRLSTALLRIQSLDEKNVLKYAQQIASEALAIPSTHPSPGEG